MKFCESACVLPLSLKKRGEVYKVAAGSLQREPFGCTHRSSSPREQSSIMNAYLKPPPASETRTFIKNSVMRSEDMPSALGVKLQAILIGYHATAAGKAILEGMKTVRFSLKSDQAYDVAPTYTVRSENDARMVR